MKSLYELYLEHTGKVSDKWKIYLTSYNDILLPFKNKKISMLEIGIQNGGSIELWDKYFHNAECFIGCDINEKCQILKYDNDKISIIIGDANKENVRDIILNKKNNFDIILDDGSHTSSDIIKTFFNYFPYLKNDGIFIFEDLHCSYWKEFEGGYMIHLHQYLFLKN
ncbi:class I SAM-dependent methyltransferase [Photobacterium kishitanii]|uniref:class I SAM-dependent methyltransferase n=1 Tax=Photobacterium kishitanii TaxID=318456 RepID=UPI00273989BE|nr:class I SAM-dependent methyltransferase [Photobacterium kishitanii]